MFNELRDESCTPAPPKRGNGDIGRWSRCGCSHPIFSRQTLNGGLFYRFPERFRDRSHRGAAGSTVDFGRRQSRSKIFIRVPRFVERAPTGEGKGGTEIAESTSQSREVPKHPARTARKHLLFFSLLSNLGSNTCCE